jgi:hypothetical protein
VLRPIEACVGVFLFIGGIIALFVGFGVNALIR